MEEITRFYLFIIYFFIRRGNDKVLTERSLTTFTISLSIIFFGLF